MGGEGAESRIPNMVGTGRNSSENFVSLHNLVNGLARQESLVAQWSECPIDIWEGMGLIPVGDSDFIFVQCPCQMDISFLSMHNILN